MEEIFGRMIIFALFLAMIGVFVRPRKPKVIHAHLNRMLMNGFFWPMAVLMVLLNLLTVAIHLFPQLDEIHPVFAIIIILCILIILILQVVYALYWSQPYSRNRMGVKAVDEAIERYKKPGERSVGVGNGWGPDLVVDGKAYKAITYYLKNSAIETGLLAFDYQGAVVTDWSMMDKIETCRTFAKTFVHPEHINARTARYMKLKRGMDQLQRRWLSGWDTIISSQIEEKDYALRLERLRAGLKYMYEDGVRYMKFLEAEAEAGNRYGNTQARSVDYRDTVRLIELWQEYGAWSLQGIQVIRDGVAAAAWLQRRLKKGEVIPGVKKAKVGEFEWMLKTMLVYKDPDKLPELEKWLEEGVINKRYSGMEDDRTALWRSRLEWVRQVDEWIAAGYTAKEIATKAQAVGAQSG